MFAISKEYTPIFNSILKISESNGKLITNMKLTKSEIQFNIKNDDVFAICEFLDEEQVMNWVIIIENIKTF